MAAFEPARHSPPMARFPEAERRRLHKMIGMQFSRYGMSPCPSPSFHSDRPSSDFEVGGRTTDQEFFR